MEHLRRVTLHFRYALLSLCMVLVIGGLAACGSSTPEEPGSLGFVTITPTTTGSSDDSPADEEPNDDATVIPVVTLATTQTPTPTPSVTTTPTSTPTITPTPVPPCVPDARFVQDVTIPDDSRVEPGSRLGKIWRVRNAGTCAWQAGYNLAFVNGTRMGAPDSVMIPAAQPGATVDIAVSLVAPNNPGRYGNTWRLRAPDGVYFGDNLTVSIMVGSDTQIPPCANEFNLWPSTIADALNQTNGNIEQVRRWLQACQVITDNYGGLFNHVIQGPAANDLIILIHRPDSNVANATGSILIYHKNGNRYALTLQKTVEGRLELLRVGDFNADNKIEIAWTYTNCGAHTCFSTLTIEQWGGSRYDQWIANPPQTATASYQFLDTTAAGWGLEIFVKGGQISSAGAGPQRPTTEIYGSPGGGPYTLFDTIIEPPICLYHQIVDANALFAVSPNAHNYNVIIAAYEKANTDNALQACGTIADELNSLRNFARFRLVLAYAAVGNSQQAQSYRDSITIAAIRGAADTFINTWNSTNDLSQACTNTINYAIANPASWNYLADWGYANPTFTAQEMCPGFPPPTTVPAPSINLNANATTLSVGDTLNLTGINAGVGLAHYTLTLDGSPIATITYQNEVIRLDDNPFLAWESSYGDGSQVTLAARVKSAGSFRLQLTAAGEVRLPPPGGWGYGSARSEEITITVVEP